LALNVTLAQLRDQAIKRADMETNAHFGTAEVNDLINSSLAELYDLILSSYEDYFVKSTPYQITLTPGTDRYALPSDFYKLHGVDVQLSQSQSTWISVSPFNFSERNLYNWMPVAWNVWGLPSVKYRLEGGYIAFLPTPTLPAAVARLWYSPAPTQLAADGDTFDGVAGWTEYVVVDAAIKMKIKEEEDASELEQRKALLGQRVITMAAGRDSGRPATVTDVHKLNSWPLSNSGDGE